MALKGSTTEEKIWNYLLGNGMNEYGAAGLMGNLFAESGLKSTNLQNSYEKKLGFTDDSYTTSVDNGDYQNFVRDSAGYGLAQWTYWSRKQNLLTFVRARNKSIGDLETQLAFLIEEMKQSYNSVYQKLRTARDVVEASNAVLLQFERPADQGATVQKQRASYGQKYYKMMHKGGKNMSNSSLVTCTVKSPNHSGTRTHAIDRITPHCVVGQLSASSIGGCFTSASREASCNYGIGTEGGVCLIVDECNRSWCSSSNANDQRAVTIECASDKTEPYAFNSTVYNKLIELCTDICRRNGKTKLVWISDKNKALVYNPASNEMLLTVHRWFANKSCPGDWLYNRMGELANTVTEKLGGKPASGTMYRVQCGAFSQKANADNMLAKVKAKGLDAFITQVGNMYKVQVGAYSVKANAEAQLAKVKSLGFDAFITTEGGKQVAAETTKKSNAEIAKEIYSGTCSDPRWSTWGNEPVRSQRLKAAGYDPKAVQAEVNKLF